MNQFAEAYRIVWEEVPEGIKENISAGTYRIFNGVVRNMSDGSKIVTHLPLRPFDASEALEGSKSLLQVAKSVEGMQAAMTGMVAISTVAIMGAIVVSTAYLANKIEKLNTAIAGIQKDIHDQNLVFYAEKISDYFGAIEALREVISKDSIAQENRDLVMLHLANLGVMRNQLYSFVNSIILLSDNFSERNKELAIDFVNMSINMIPKSVFIESQAAFMIERFALGDGLLEYSARKYENLIENYRKWANDKVREISQGHKSAGEAVLISKSEEIKMVLGSEENRLLLKLAA